MKKLSFSEFISKQKTLRYFLATLLLTAGIYFAYPIRGIIAVFPLCLFFSILAYLCWNRLAAHLATATAIAFFYSLTTEFYDPFSFAIYVCATALLAALAVRLFGKILKKKKILLVVPLLLVLAGGAVLPCFFAGTPSAFLKAKEDTAEYLSKIYPDQAFEGVTVYYNWKERCYRAEVEYLFEGNPLTSSIIFSETVRDGFLEDFALWMQEKRKSVLIDVLKNCNENVVVDSSGLAEKTPDGVFHGSYGAFGTEMEPLFHFSATFREEKPDRRGFADACRSVMATLKESGFDYGSITFYALDAGNVVYQCTVTPETDAETVLSLVKYAN